QTTAYAIETLLAFIPVLFRTHPNPAHLGDHCGRADADRAPQAGHLLPGGGPATGRPGHRRLRAGGRGYRPRTVPVADHHGRAARSEERRVGRERRRRGTVAAT